MVIHSNNAPFVISRKKEQTISRRYHTITKAINKEIWGIKSDTKHSIYVGSYGRNTAVNTSDVDILVELPSSEFTHYIELAGNKPSRLLATIRNVITNPYATSHPSADGQIIGIDFSDRIRFEILPVFENIFGGYTYPNADNGGRWMRTYPKIEQDKMRERNNLSNGLLMDTCRDMRYIRDHYYHSYHLPGIIIDSFVYNCIGNWHWPSDFNSSNSNNLTYEEYLLRQLGSFASYSNVKTPGSNQLIMIGSNYDCLFKVLRKLNTEDWCKNE